MQYVSSSRQAFQLVDSKQYLNDSRCWPFLSIDAYVDLQCNI